MDRGAWEATVHGVAKSQTQLNTEELMGVGQGVGWGGGARKQMFRSVQSLSRSVVSAQLRPHAEFVFNFSAGLNFFQIIVG